MGSIFGLSKELINIDKKFGKDENSIKSYFEEVFDEKDEIDELVAHTKKSYNAINELKNKYKDYRDKEKIKKNIIEILLNNVNKEEREEIIKLVYEAKFTEGKNKKNKVMTFFKEHKSGFFAHKSGGCPSKSKKIYPKKIMT